VLSSDLACGTDPKHRIEPIAERVNSARERIRMAPKTEPQNNLQNDLQNDLQNNLNEYFDIFHRIEGPGSSRAFPAPHRIPAATSRFPFGFPLPFR
jgi:hypothetical protein